MNGMLQGFLAIFFSLPLFGAESLIIYTYDAFTGKQSFGEYIKEAFHKKTGNEIQLVSFGTAGEALNQIVLEGKKTRADIILGLDEVLFQKGKSKELFGEWNDALFKSVDKSLFIEKEKRFLPIDFGFLSFLYDSSRTKVTKKINLRDLPEQLGKDQKVVLQDPRTSSLGLEFLVWTKTVSGPRFVDFWNSLSKNILTIAPGWTGAYELFLRKRAEFVLSFTTSTAYHRIREKKKNIVPLIFSEGHFRQIEGMVLLNTSLRKKQAFQFAQFILGREAQEQLPLYQWMYPARLQTSLPIEFQEIPIPNAIEWDREEVTHFRDQWIQEWALALAQPVTRKK